MGSIRSAILAFAILLVASACGGDAGRTTTGASPGNTSAGTTKTPSDGKNARTSPTEPVEDPAPEFEATTFEGETFSLAEQRGTPVVLNFWESW
ncbi:MAG: redoxin domain-containing protein [Actinomycetota bacterium]|nr:redoxin domain-containing protein [Actinomycetota bacterium]